MTKGYTFARRPPPPALTKDGISVSVFGFQWISETDLICIVYGPLSFAERIRGRRKKDAKAHEIPEELVRRICLGKVHELFDLSGLVTPIMAGFKLDLRVLFKNGLGWDDPIPSEDYETWVENFRLLERIGELKYSRSVVPENAEGLNVELIGAGDASSKMTCAAVYVRYKLKDNSYSCQLILGKSKIVPEDMTLPGA